MPKPSLPPDSASLEHARPQRPMPQKRRGGAWTVAYADFVTALMALFIVLWMLNAGAKVRDSVQGYFRDPRGYTHKLGVGSANAGEAWPSIVEMSTRFSGASSKPFGRCRIFPKSAKILF